MLWNQKSLEEAGELAADMKRSRESPLVLMGTHTLKALQKGSKRETGKINRH